MPFVAYISLSQEAYAIYRKIPRGSRSKVIQELLKAFAAGDIDVDAVPYRVEAKKNSADVIDLLR